MRSIWLNKRLYEALPFVYMGIGAAGLAASFYFGGGLVSSIVIVLGLAFVTGGLVVLLKRRGYRASRSREAFDDRL
ncbi:MAG TPA: hypothetical protein VF339_20265 [Gammaproteobacteria bacterium]